jgi:hypothetical protein
MQLFKKITDGFLHESFAPCALLMLRSRAMYGGHSIGDTGDKSSGLWTTPHDLGRL